MHDINIKMNNLRQVLPSSLEFLLYAIISLALLGIGNISAISVGIGLSQNKQVTEGIINQAAKDVLNKIDSLHFSSTIITYIFFFVIALVIVNIILRFLLTLKEVKSDINITTKYIRPAGFSNSKFWGQAIGRFLFHMFSIGSFLIWGGLFLLVLLPWGTKLAGKYLINFAGASYITDLIFGWIIITISMSIWAITFKFMVRSR